MDNIKESQREIKRIIQLLKFSTNKSEKEILELKVIELINELRKKQKNLYRLNMLYNSDFL
jgi:transposase-like protein